MRLQREPYGRGTTRYWITAHLGPHSTVVLRRRAGDRWAAQWHTGEHSELVRGLWLSPYDDLYGEIVGVEHDFGPPD